MEKVIRPGVFVLAALIWGLLFLGETLLCSSDIADATKSSQQAPVTEQADETE